VVAVTGAAVVATAYYLFLPLSILLSRSFQPDSLMMMLFLISLFSLLTYNETPSNFWLLTAAGLSGLALLYRPLIVFTLLGAFTALAVHAKGTWKRILDRRFLTFVVLSLLPSVAYYGYGIFGAGFMRWKVETSFRPDLLLHREFWQGWLELAVDGVNYTALIAALLGVSLLPRGLPRALVAGLGIGYIAFGLVFTMHIHTHGYYQAQLIPIVALAFSPLVTLVINRIEQLSNEWYRWLPVIGAILLAGVLSVREVRQKLAVTQYFESAAIAREIGEAVHHGSRTVYLSPFYGLPLQYYGELSGAYWFRKESYYLYRRPGDRERSIQERLDALGFVPEYFVVTHFTEYAAYHLDLKDYLDQNCSLLVARDRYQIYHLCTP
jgi:4-amino-4-deoxy-L-arabinose transferase-like glycosyltransferase